MKITLILGDSVKVLPTLPSESVELVLTDPPFNVGKQYEKEFIEWNDDLPDDVYLDMLRKVFTECYRILKPKGQLYVKIGHKYLFQLREILLEIGFKFCDLLIWHYQGIKGRAKPYFWFHAYEPILFFYKEKLKKLNNCYPLGITNLNVLTLKSTTKRALSIYNKKYYVAQMPYEIPYIIIAKTTQPNETVLDPFVGSGTTLLACKMLNRNGIGIDFNPKAIEIAKKRLNWASSLSNNIEWEFKVFP